MCVRPKATPYFATCAYALKPHRILSYARTKEIRFRDIVHSLVEDSGNNTLHKADACLLRHMHAATWACACVLTSSHVFCSYVCMCVHACTHMGADTATKAAVDNFAWSLATELVDTPVASLLLLHSCTFTSLQPHYATCHKNGLPKAKKAIKKREGQWVQHYETGGIVTSFLVAFACHTSTAHG